MSGGQASTIGNERNVASIQIELLALILKDNTRLKLSNNNRVWQLNEIIEPIVKYFKENLIM